MLDDRQNPVPLPGEERVMTIDQGVEITLLVSNSRSTGGIGGSGDKLKETGKIWLTDKRVSLALNLLAWVTSGPDLSSATSLQLIFQTIKGSGNAKPEFDSFSVLLHGILSTQFVQPTFAANYLVMELKAATGGGLSDGAKCEVRFKDQPMLPFINTLEKSRERAVYRMRDAMFEDDLPTYSSSATPSESEPISPSTDSSAVATEAPPGYVA